MGLRTAELRLSTQGDTDVVDITSQVQEVVGDAGVGDGQALAFVRGSTAAISTMEFEPAGVNDLREMVERLIPPTATTSTTGSTTTQTRTPTSGRPWSDRRRQFP